MATLNEGWINYLRNTSRQDQESRAASRQGFVTCRECRAAVPRDLSTFTEHYAIEHGGSLSGEAIEAELQSLSLQSKSSAPPRTPSQTQTWSSRTIPSINPSSGNHQSEPSEMNEPEPGNKKLRSPPAPERPSSRGASQTPVRSRSRIPDSEFDRSKQSPSRALYNPQDSIPTTQPKSISHARSLQGKQPTGQPRGPSTTTAPQHPSETATTEYGSDLAGLDIDIERRLQTETTSGLSRRSFLPVVIGSKTFDTLPDTNASRNVMTEEFAFSIGAPIDRDPRKQHVFTNALGQRSRSSGVTVVELSFPDDGRKKWKCDFAVVKKCAAPLVMGAPFLELTGTLTKFRRRLRWATSSVKKAWRLMHMDVPRRKMSCYVDAEHVFVNTDSGADADFVSLDYAKFREWDINLLPDHEGFVILSDRQVVKVLGYVDTELRIRGNARQRRFYIIDGLVCDVLLGDETLDTMDVFNKYCDSFIDMSSCDENNEFCMMQWMDFYNGVEDEVNKMVGTASMAGSNGNILSRLGLGMRRTPAFSDRAILLELMRKLEEVDIMEGGFQSLAQEKLSTLAGNELASMKLSDEARKKRHDETWRNISRQIQSYQQRVKQ